MAAHYAELESDPRALKWWLLWKRIANRFTFDAQCAGVVFERLTRDFDTEDYEEAVAAMALLYNAFCPAPEDVTETRNGA